MESSLIQIAALGRPLHPGMLYDCRNDSIVPGTSLWDNEEIENEMNVHEQNQTKCEVVTTDSFSKKSSLLGVSASLKASIIGGLVEIGGSAKYLEDKVKSESQQRITMHYSQRTVFKQLVMKEIDDIKYPKLFDQGTATHVITAVLYGADALIIFDQTAAKHEAIQDVHGELHGMIKKIPNCSFDSSGELKITDEDKERAEKIGCTFYGDFILDQSPTTYLDAVKVYKNLPKMLGENGEKAVPITAWLYPLKNLDSRAAKLVRDISDCVVMELETVMEELNMARVKANDLLEMSTNIQASDIQQKLEAFRDILRQYKIILSKTLAELLPGIRNGDQDENMLVQILKFHCGSFFRKSTMQHWLTMKRNEIEVLTSYISYVSEQGNVTLASDSQHSEIMFDPQYESVITFCFTSLKYEEPYLSDLRQCLQTENFWTQTSHVHSLKDDAEVSWFKSPVISKIMRENLNIFKRFCFANKEEKGIKFLISYLPDRAHPGASIHHYYAGKLMDASYKPLIKPTAPVVVDTGVDNVILRLQSSQCPNTPKYIVEFKEDKDGDYTKAVEHQDNHPVLGLQPGTTYHVRYRLMSAAGVSEPSEDIEIQTKGKVIAFSAKLQRYHRCPNGEQLLTFATVLVNEGNGYNPNTGVFTCPESGFYYVTMRAAHCRRAQFGIYRNDELMVASFHGGGHNVGASGTVLELCQGDRVYVKIRGPGKQNIYASPESDTVFAGFRLS